jgi:hypothetical protein
MRRAGRAVFPVFVGDPSFIRSPAVFLFPVLGGPSNDRNQAQPARRKNPEQSDSEKFVRRNDAAMAGEGVRSVESGMTWTDQTPRRHPLKRAIQ